MLRQPGCWLRSSHSFKECVIAHWSSDAAPTIIGTKRLTEIAGFEATRSGRGAFCTAVKVNREVCWSVQKSRCWHK